MLGIEQFKKIKEYKELGLSRLKVSEKLDLAYKTVSNWWDRDEDYFYKFQSEHEFILDNYREFLIDILKITPSINNTVLLLRLKEKFTDLEIPSTTFFRYIKRLREQTGIIKPPRTYALRSETDPGYEGQVDFGQHVMKTMYDRNIRIYFFCMTLSFSRMKFAYFTTEPFDTKKVILAHTHAFKYFGGRPQMMVYDQDKTMFVSENLGDIILTSSFEEYVRETGYSIYLCKKYDPETKGKIENTVSFVKRSFLDGRIYTGIDNLNSDCLTWLDNEGNGCVNVTTNKIPRELFKKESRLLKKVYIKKNKDVVVVSVKKSTVKYDKVMYSLPTAKVLDGDRIRVERHDDDLLMYKALTNELIYKHKVAKDFIGVVPCAENTKEVPTIEEELLAVFKDFEDAVKFIHLMRKQKPRYVYPQCSRLSKMTKYHTLEEIVEAMKYCLSVDTATVFELSSYLVYKHGKEKTKKYIPSQTFAQYLKRADTIRDNLHGKQ